MRASLLTLVAGLLALALIPSTALAAPKKAQVKFSAATYSVTENAGGGTTINVLRSGNTRSTATMTLAIDATSTAAASDYTISSPAGLDSTHSVTLTFNPGVTKQTITVTPVDNSTANAPNKKVVFKLSGPNIGTQLKPPSTATLTIVDDEGPGQLDFSSNGYSVLESGGFATITVNRIGASNLSESVQYQTATAPTSPATPTADYTPISTPQTLTFAPGEMSKTFQVQITDDSNAENPENVNLLLSNPQNLSGGSAPAIGANNPATLTINDDDVPTFSFQSTLFSVGESDGTATITVKRGGATNVATSVNYSTSDGTATAGSDYTAASGTLNFAAGETQKTFPVTILPDTSDEPNETVDLALSNGATAELSIVDDDTPTESVQFSDTTYTVNEADGTATIAVQLSHALGVATSVHYATSDGSATDGSDYTGQTGTLNFAAGDTQQTFQIPILNPATPDPEDDETVNLTLTTPGTNLVLGDPSTATLTIADDDPSGLLDFKSLTYNASETGLVATITVERVGGVGGPVAVDYATSDGTATAGADYSATSGTLTWASGDGADKTFNVPVTWDGRAEGPETINLGLSNPDGADLGPNTAGVIAVADDGASGPARFTAGSYSVGESDGLATITVTRSGGSLGGPVSVDYATADDSAVAGSDYTAASGTLTFGPGEVTKSFTVPITSDSVHEDSKGFQVLLSNPTGGMILGSPAGAGVTIADDDAAPASQQQDSTPTTPVNTQSTPADPNPSGSQTAAPDKRAPKLKLSSKKIQKALKAKLLTLAASCDENCALTVTAKVAGKKPLTVGKAKVKAARGAKAMIKIKLSKKVLAKLVKVLKSGKVKVTVSVVARDAAGNQSKASRPITVRQ